MRYPQMAKLIRDRMAVLDIKTTRQLQDRLAEANCSVHENMISRWLNGRGRPQGPRLSALLDVLGLVRADERRRATEIAYLPPSALDGADAADSDDDDHMEEE